MHRAVPIGLAGVALLLLLGVPFLGVRWGFPDDRVLPSTASAHQVGDQLRQDFANNSDTAVTVVVPNTDGIGPNDIEGYAADLSACPTFRRSPLRWAHSLQVTSPDLRPRPPARFPAARSSPSRAALRCSPIARRTARQPARGGHPGRQAGRHDRHRAGEPGQRRRDHVTAAAGARTHRRHHVGAAVPVDRQHRHASESVGARCIFR